ncbi:MAG: membrane protein insertion efficiency factor YidD [Pseudobdellovibrionaceae bacterium]
MQNAIAPGQAVQIYRSAFAPTLYSRCKWFPSDSNYATVAQNKCGATQGALMAFSRFLSEEDAPRMGYNAINNKGHIEYVDFPTRCWF